MELVLGPSENSAGGWIDLRTTAVARRERVERWWRETLLLSLKAPIKYVGEIRDGNEKNDDLGKMLFPDAAGSGEWPIGESLQE